MFGWTVESKDFYLNLFGLILIAVALFLLVGLMIVEV